MCNPGAAMRFLTSVVFLAAAVPTLAVARNVYDSHFAGAGNHACFVRSYDTDHLAKHPQQQVTQIGVMISLLGGDRAAPDLNITGWPIATAAATPLPARWKAMPAASPLRARKITRFY